MKHNIINQIGAPAALEQLAEESAELSKAALKLARVIRAENPTPISRAEAVSSLKEELGDVRPQWTPTVERLPEKNGKYLCICQGRSIETGMFLNGHFRLYGEIKDRLVSHWMPLPELPDGTDMMEDEQDEN